MIYVSEWKETDRMPERREQTEAAEKLLLSGLRLEYGWERLPKISRDKNGKPYFTSVPDVFFNYSHCRAGVLCAIGKGPVGADMETVRAFRPSLAARICCGGELDFLTAAPGEEQALLLTRLWTAKEAYLKYTGEGIRRDLRTVDVSKVCFEGRDEWLGCFWLLWTKENACMCVCARQRETLVRSL